MTDFDSKVILKPANCVNVSSVIDSKPFSFCFKLYLCQSSL